MSTETLEPAADPADAAMEAEYNPGPRTYFGSIQVDTWYCILEKGQGKIPFDLMQHGQDRKRTAIDFNLQPIDPEKYPQPITRELIAESKDWTSIVRPSLQKLNIDLRGLNGKWVQVQLEPTGRKYTNASGEERQATTFIFQAIFGSEQECQAAATAFFANASNRAGTDQPQEAATPTNGNGLGNTVANPAEKETAKRFLPALWASSGKDPVKLAEMIARNPLLARYFTIDSPEVVAVCSQA